MGGKKKPFLELAGEPLLVHALRPFLADPRVVAVVVAVSPEDVTDARSWVEALDERVTVVAGGDSRADSVARAVARMPEDVDVILVHDAARPLVTGWIVSRCIETALDGEGAVAGWPATDTLKEVDGEDRILRTPERSRIWHAQTPQGFPAEALREALADEARRSAATDDASLVEATGLTVRMVEGAPDNIKVTRPEDLPIAETLLRRRTGGVGEDGSADTGAGNP
jgi:2-C-methyl-D-erythritol 4-phosphate cytidylyltransferase